MLISRFQSFSSLALRGRYEDTTRRFVILSSPLFYFPFFLTSSFFFLQVYAFTLLFVSFEWGFMKKALSQALHTLHDVDFLYFRPLNSPTGSGMSPPLSPLLTSSSNLFFYLLSLLSAIYRNGSATLQPGMLLDRLPHLRPLPRPLWPACPRSLFG